MQHRNRPTRIRKSRAILATSLLTLATVIVMPTSLGAASVVQQCTAPLASAQSGRQDIVPGINGLATAQKITSKVNLFQCSDTKKTGRSGILNTTLKTSPITCTAFTKAHVWNFSATIKWVNKTTSTAKLAFATSGASRLANLTGTITAGVYAGHSVTAQFKWKPIISPHSKKFPDACANTVATGDPGRIKIIGDIESTIKPLTIT
jgi:hypothetical protein